MLGKSTSFLQRNRFIYDGFKSCIYNVGKNVLNYTVKHQYPLSVSIWSYFLIEVGRTAAATTFGEHYVYNLDTCREALCNNYWNKSENSTDFFHNSVLEFTCSEQQNSSYSFVECLQDLCKYMATLGENFYACQGGTLEPTQLLSLNETIEQTSSDIQISSPLLIDYWNKICPKKEFRHPEKPSTKLKELSYLTRCLEKLCTPDNLIRFESGKDISTLCANKDILKLYDLLHSMSRAIKKIQKVTIESNGDTTNMISNIVVALATVVGGVATIAAAVISYRTSRAANVLNSAIPSLDQGVRTMTRAAAETTRAIIRGASIVEEIMPKETLQVLNDLASSMSQSTSSFYTAAEDLPTSPEIKVKFDPNTKVINIVGGNLGLGAGSVVSAGTGGIISIVGPLKGNVEIGTQKESQIAHTVEKIAEATKRLLPTLEPQTFNIRKSWWFSYLKDALLPWDKAYCYYEGIEKSLLCKLPRPPFDRYISFFVEDLKEFFSKNSEILCTPIKLELWCNWGNFLDLLLPTRNITFIDENCQWDHFGLQIGKISNDTYIFKALGTCYNEINLIKV